MNIFCRTFIKIEKEFVLVEDFAGKIKNTDYADGAINLKINDVVLFDKALWNDVVSLWAYILWGLENIANKKSHKVYFPDQPIEIRFSYEKDDTVIFKVCFGEGRRVRVKRAAFVLGMLAEAERFFRIFSEIALRSNCQAYAEQLRQIEEIRKIVLQPSRG